MAYSQEQIDEIKRYCEKVSALSEGGITFLLLEKLRLPAGCEPSVCDALLCPVSRDGYPSRLYLSVQVSSRYSRNWNMTNARIGERNWVAFSWRVDIPNPSPAQLLIAHLMGFTKEK